MLASLASVTATSPLVLVLASLLGGSTMAALTTFVIERRKLNMQRTEKELLSEKERYTRKEERDSIIAESSEKAILFMRNELDVAQKALERTRSEVASLKSEIARMEALVQVSREERDRLRQELNEALQERARLEVRQRELEDRVLGLEAATLRRRTSDKRPDA